MKMPKQKTLAQLQKEVDAFNSKYKVGDVVKLKTDGSGIQDATIRHQATIMGGHSAMGWFEKYGSYLLSHVIE